MEFTLFDRAETDQVIALYAKVFADSEGEDEGQVIGNLVSNLINQTPEEQLIGCMAKQEGTIVGCIFFSRFTVPNNQSAFLLSPVAISTESQGRGTGEQLIAFGLDYLRSLNAELCFTYGNPDFYSRNGFQQIAEELIKAPYPLSQPIGWLAQRLDGEPMVAIPGETFCAEAFADASYW